MKTFIFLLITIFSSVNLISQQFEWANNYDIQQANEVAGLTIDNAGNSFAVGVFDAPVSLPYLGDAFLIKANADGELAWTKIIEGDLFFGDITAVEDKVCVVGQSHNSVTYDGNLLFGGSGSFMFMLLINADGSLAWSQQIIDRHAQFANIDYHQGTIALQARGQFNSGNHMMYFDAAGNLLQERAFDDFSIVDLSFYNGQTYLNCLGGFDDFFVDDVLIAAPSLESSTFILALDEQLIAQWAHSSSAINNHDGRVEANEAGVFSYKTILTEDFNFTSEIWHLDFVGNLINSINPPVFTNAVSLYPDMAVTECHVALFAQNDFDFASHEIIIMDHDLNVISEKSIDGASYLYSGQISSFDNEFYVSHIHSGNLNFDDEITLEMDGSAVQSPYLAKIFVDPSDCLVSIDEVEKRKFKLFPNPADNMVTIQSDLINYRWEIQSIEGKVVKTGNVQSNLNFTINLSDIQKNGIYILSIFSGDLMAHKKLIIK